MRCHKLVKRSVPLSGPCPAAPAMLSGPHAQISSPACVGCACAHTQSDSQHTIRGALYSVDTQHVPAEHTDCCVQVSSGLGNTRWCAAPAAPHTHATIWSARTPAIQQQCQVLLHNPACTKGPGVASCGVQDMLPCQSTTAAQFSRGQVGSVPHPPAAPQLTAFRTPSEIARQQAEGSKP
jgi:hypothetical protein